MTRILVFISIFALLGPGIARADPTFLLGGGISFGSGGSPEFTISGKVLSNDERDKPVAGLGLNYYVGSGEFGADLGLGYLFDDSAVVVGYDFLGQAPLLTFGWAETEENTAPAD